MPTKAPLIADLTVGTFNAYNQAGPAERAGLTHDGKRVPPFDRLGAVVAHKWAAAAAAGARRGADVVLRLIDAGTPLDVVRARVAEVFAAPKWTEPGSEGAPPAPAPSAEPSAPSVPAEPT